MEAFPYAQAEALAIQSVGARDGLPTAAQIEAFLAGEEKLLVTVTDQP